MQNSLDSGMNESVIINLRKRVGYESSVVQTDVQFKKKYTGCSQMSCLVCYGANHELIRRNVRPCTIFFQVLLSFRPWIWRDSVVTFSCTFIIKCVLQIIIIIIIIVMALVKPVMNLRVS
jgi:hypothetical protein